MFDSLHRRPRSRGLAPRLASFTRGVIAGDARDPRDPYLEFAGSDLLAALDAYEPPPYPDPLGQVTRAIIDRLTGDDTEAILAAADAPARAYYDAAIASERPFLLLHYAVHFGVEPAVSRTRLPRAQPPVEVHAMARGLRAAAGGLWFADLVVDAATRAGAPLRAGARVLDFGCSSGRVLGPLAAWRPDVEWLGCDPNAAAAAWTNANLPGVRAFLSPQEPPVELDAASLDLVYAVSVWSHFGETQAIRWLAEMGRLLRPGGALVMTTQGLPSVAHYWRLGSIDPGYAWAATQQLLVHGHAYFQNFGEEGDWGVKHPEWGMAYLSADWLGQRLDSTWSLALLEPARLDTNQDLVVLVRR